MKRAGAQRILGLVVIILGAIVAFSEFAFYVNHPHRHGPAIYIAILAVAIICIGINIFLSNYE